MKAELSFREYADLFYRILSDFEPVSQGEKPKIDIHQSKRAPNSTKIAGSQKWVLERIIGIGSRHKNREGPHDQKENRATDPDPFDIRSSEQ
ncbi:MAG TPA: hypothetical protein PKD54_06040 [Pirellulaceae bacterium]|nr:hypothetical protein [Pirellulaceae bacterium]